MRVAPSDKYDLGKALFRFLLAVRDGRPGAARPLVAEDPALHALCADPYSDLCKALRHCVDAFLLELGPDPAQWGKISIPSWVLGFALAVNNCLAPTTPVIRDGEAEPYDPVLDFTARLVSTLPPARSSEEAIACHAVLRGVEAALPHIGPERARLMHAVIERSPLTALWSPDLHTPTALNDIASELLHGCPVDGQGDGKAWKDGEGWVDVVSSLLADPRIAGWVRNRWLGMPETRLACRNVGLLLEALRRRGGHRSFILEFYEAYGYFRSETRTNELGEQVRVWPMLLEIEKLLRTPGDSEAAIRVNRWGNEYFMKFRPLVQIIIAENVVPPDYALLSREFAVAVQSLLPYVTDKAGGHISFDDDSPGGA